MKAKTICPRCHRLREVKSRERYCVSCLALRKQEESPRRFTPTEILAIPKLQSPKEKS